MSMLEILFLILVFSTFGAFMFTLAYLSFTEAPSGE